MMGWRDCSTSPFTLSSLLWPSLLFSAPCLVPGGASPGEKQWACVCTPEIYTKEMCVVKGLLSLLQ